VPLSWLAGSVVAGTALAVIFSLSPLTLIVAALLPVLLGAAGAGLPRDELRWLWLIVVSSVLVRAAVIVVLLLISDHDSQATAILSGDEAYSLSRTLRIRNILLGIPLLKYDYQIAAEEYGRSSYLTLLTVLQVLFGPSPYGVRLVNVLLFVAAAMLLFRLALKTYGRLPAFSMLVAILLLPTLFFWSISILKESLYFALVATVLGGTFVACRDERLVKRVAAGGAALVALWALRDLRAGAIYLVGGGIAIGLLLHFASASLRRLAVSTAAMLLIGAALLSRPAVRDYLHTAVEDAAVVQLGHVFTRGHAYKTLDEGFYRRFNPELELTTDEAARYVVRALASFAVQPWPWRMATDNELVFLPEHVLWYVALLLGAVGFVVGLSRDRLTTCLLAGLMLPTVVVVALTNGNVGTLIRFRGLVWPYLLMFASLGACALIERALTAGRRGVGPLPQDAVPELS
jgi:hypothetical protein